MARLTVRLTPRGGADRIEGWDADAEGRAVLKARVRAARRHASKRLRSKDFPTPKSARGWIWTAEAGIRAFPHRRIAL